MPFQGAITNTGKAAAKCHPRARQLIKHHSVSSSTLFTEPGTAPLWLFPKVRMTMRPTCRTNSGRRGSHNCTTVDTIHKRGLPGSDQKDGLSVCHLGEGTDLQGISWQWAFHCASCLLKCSQYFPSHLKASPSSIGSPLSLSNQ